MSENINQELEKILYDLELQILDLKLENKKKQIKFYFDTADIEDAISGFGRFYPDNIVLRRKLDESIFDSSKTLVHSLFISGNLGKVHLLSPHKAELFNRIRLLKDRRVEEYERKAKKFISDTGFNDIDWYRAKCNEDYRKNVIASLKPEQANRFFRMVQNLFPWNNILEFIIKEKRLVISSNNSENNSKPEYSKIFGSSYYEKLTKIINHLRPYRPKNNITDAICIGMLIERNNDADNNKEIPRFFASADSILSLFLESNRVALKEKVENHLKKSARSLRGSNAITEDIYQIQDRLYSGEAFQNKPINLIRNENYFIFKAIYTSGDNSLSEEERRNSSIERLKKWQRQIREFIRVPEKVTSQPWVKNLDRTEREQVQRDIISQSWLDVFIKRKDEFFFREVWLKSDSLASREPDSSALKDFSNALKAVQAYDEFKEDWGDEFEKTISKHIDKTDEEAKKEVRDASMIVSLSEKLNKRLSRRKDLKDLSELFDDGSNLKRRFYDYFPIHRYSLPDKIYEEVIAALDDILKGNSTAKSTLLINYAELLDVDTASFENSNTLAKVCATLYAIKAKKELWYLLEKFIEVSLLFSFKVFFGELNLDKNLELKDLGKDVTGRKKRAKKIMESLESDLYSLENDSPSNKLIEIKKLMAGLAIGLSLLYYWRWRNDGGKS